MSKARTLAKDSLFDVEEVVMMVAGSKERLWLAW